MSEPYRRECSINYNPADRMAVTILFHYFEQKDKANYFMVRGYPSTAQSYKRLQEKYYALFDFHDWKTRAVPEGASMEDFLKLVNEQKILDDFVRLIHADSRNNMDTLQQLRQMWHDARTYQMLLETRNMIDAEMKILFETQVEKTKQFLLILISNTDDETINEIEFVKPELFQTCEIIEGIACFL